MSTCTSPLHEFCGSPSTAPSSPDWKHLPKLKLRYRVSFHRRTLIEINGIIYRNSSWTIGKQIVNTFGRWCTGTWKWTNQNKTVQAHKLSCKQMPEFMSQSLCSGAQREQGCAVLVRLNPPLPPASYRHSQSEWPGYKRTSFLPVGSSLCPSGELEELTKARGEHWAGTGAGVISLSLSLQYQHQRLLIIHIRALKTGQQGEPCPQPLQWA